MKKQTAANNEFLKRVKKEWNAKIYKKAAELVNAAGEDQARAFIQQFTTRPLAY